MSLKKIKLNILRAIAVLVIAAALLPLETIFASAAESGSCGAALSWSYDAGTLTISGSGAMTDFKEPDMAPWYHLREEIRRVILPDGLTSIGSLAFYECKNLTSVIMPSSMRTIGYYAFAECSSLSMLRLGGYETSIGTAAFYGCVSLDAVRLPYSLQTLGSQAFYRCESLTTVTIEAELKNMGTSVFAYCKNLVTVTINSKMTALPDWTFYGCEKLSSVVFPVTVEKVENYAFKNCDSLSTVYYEGDEKKAEALRQEISEDVPSFGSSGHISTSKPTGTSTGGKATENSDGSVTQHNVTVKQNENVTVVTEIKHTHVNSETYGGSYTASVTVTVENEDGWDDAVDTVKDSLKQINELNSTSTPETKVEVTVYMKEEDSPAESFVENMVGRDVEVTVVSQNGSSWQFDCAELPEITPTPDSENEVTPEEEKVHYGYSFIISSASEKTRKALGTDVCYTLGFTNSASINAEVLVQLPSNAASYSNAFLYQVEKNGSFTRLQAVKVDQNAIAHFYLASVDKDTQYVIGLNVPNETTDDVIIPDEMNSQLGNALERLEKIEYVSTGVRSAWGLDVGDVTLIMIGAIVLAGVVIGAVMFFINKRKLKKGYVPAEYEE